MTREQRERRNQVQRARRAAMTPAQRERRNREQRERRARLRAEEARAAAAQAAADQAAAADAAAVIFRDRNLPLEIEELILDWNDASAWLR